MRILFLLCCLTCFSTHLPGQLPYARYIGGVGDDRGEAIVPAADDGCWVAGLTQGGSGQGRDVWLVRFDANGDTVWSRSYEFLGAESASGLLQDQEGDLYLCGSSAASVQHLYVLKTDSGGRKAWETVIDFSDESWGQAICQLPSGKLVVAGGTLTHQPGRDDWDGLLASVSREGFLDWKRSYPALPFYQFNAVVPTPDGGLMALGNTADPTGGALHFGLLKTDSLGYVQWWQEYATDAYSEGWALTGLPNGDFLVGGFTFGTGNGDALLMQVGPTGSIRWSKTYGGNKFDQIRALTRTRDGGIAAAGSTESEGEGFSDLLILRLDDTGDSLWRRIFGGIPPDMAYDIAEMQDGSLVATGIKGNFTPLDQDLYLVRVSAGGAISITPSLSQNLISLYPQPVFHFAAITFPTSLAVKSWKIISMDGKTVRKGTHLNSGQRLNLTDLPNGIYLFSLLSHSNEISLIKFQVSH